MKTSLLHLYLLPHIFIFTTLTATESYIIASRKTLLYISNGLWYVFWVQFPAAEDSIKKLLPLTPWSAERYPHSCCFSPVCSPLCLFCNFCVSFFQFLSGTRSPRDSVPQILMFIVTILNKLPSFKVQNFSPFTRTNCWQRLGHLPLVFDQQTSWQS